MPPRRCARRRRFKNAYDDGANVDAARFASSVLASTVNVLTADWSQLLERTPSRVTYPVASLATGVRHAKLNYRA